MNVLCAPSRAACPATGSSVLARTQLDESATEGEDRPALAVTRTHARRPSPTTPAQSADQLDARAPQASGDRSTTGSRRPEVEVEVEANATVGAAMSMSPSVSAISSTPCVASQVPSVHALAELARELACSPELAPQSDAFRHLVVSRLRIAWPDADARQLAQAAIRVRLLLIGQDTHPPGTRPSGR